jgi:hypothetical protein
MVGTTIVVLRRVLVPKAIEVPIEVRFSIDTCRAIEVPIKVDRGSLGYPSAPGFISEKFSIACTESGEYERVLSLGLGTQVTGNG